MPLACNWPSKEVKPAVNRDACAATGFPVAAQAFCARLQVSNGGVNGPHWDD